LPSSQLVGQVSTGSQVSPTSTTPLPQVAEQSESSAEVHPTGQQPSPPTQVLMAVLLQATLQVAALPVSWSRVQALPSSQVAGHVVAGSQVSPASRTPLPQLAEQSVSAVASQPTGQQPSPGAHALMAVWLHATLQLAALPVIWSWVHALPSSQLAGHVVAGSQVSPASTTPLPQLAEQSESSAALHAAGQQPSPPTHVVTALLVHATLHV
jgi:hypothetical protein